MNTTTISAHIPKPIRSFYERLTDWFSVDTRSLALARIGMGIFIFADLLWRLRSAEWHYTDIGALPRDVFLSDFTYHWSFSFHLANGTKEFALAILSFHAICAILLAIGWRTRIMTVIVAVLTVSLHNRNWYLNNGGDDLLRSLMILAIFIPWGEMWSVDQWQKGESEKPARRIRGTWVLCWFLQAFVCYFCSYILKTSPIWRTDYTALYYASHLDIFATHLGRYLRDFPGLMKGFTIATIFLEWLGPLVLVFSWVLPRKLWPWMKGLVVVSFWGLHLGIIVCMNIGLFPYYCLAMWAVFLPTELWDKVASWVPGVGRSMRAVLSRISGPPTLVQGPTDRALGTKILHQLLGALIFFTLFFWNMTSITTKSYGTLWRDIGRWAHLYQKWNMFAPFPKQENLWLEIPAELEDGSSLELITGDPDIHGPKEHRFPDEVQDEHWRKFYMNIADNEKLAKHYAGAWCRLWNRSPENGGRRPRLRRFTINMYYYMILPDYQKSPMQKKVVWNHWCFADDFKGQGQGKGSSN